MSSEVRFLTSADSRFFVGAAAMLNSLRLSGNRSAAFVVDAGLRPEQHERRARAAQVLSLPSALQGLHPAFTKITADLFWSNGIVVLIDSNMIVTSPLDDLIEQAAAGRIAVHPDHPITRGRQSPEWVRRTAFGGFPNEEQRLPQIQDPVGRQLQCPSATARFEASDQPGGPQHAWSRDMSRPVAMWLRQM